MKRTFTILAGICFALSGMAQTDSTQKDSDTIRVGNILIIKNKKDGKNDDDKDRDDDVKVERRKSYKPIFKVQHMLNKVNPLHEEPDVDIDRFAIP